HHRGAQQNGLPEERSAQRVREGEEEEQLAGAPRPGEAGRSERHDHVRDDERGDHARDTQEQGERLLLAGEGVRVDEPLREAGGSRAPSTSSHTKGARTKPSTGTSRTWRLTRERMLTSTSTLRSAGSTPPPRRHASSGVRPHPRCALARPRRGGTRITRTAL